MAIRAVLVASILLFFVSPSCRPQAKSWQDEPGALLCSGATSMAFRNRPGQILSVYGWRREPNGNLPEISLYHAIVLLPSLTPLMGSGDRWQTDGPQCSEILSWKIQLGPPHDYTSFSERLLTLRSARTRQDVTCRRRNV
jgi:hypothetical protein